MSAATPRYPVDRYLVESSKKFELVNIIEDEIWNSEPALRPEDEIILRKLHDMLQSTADDLKLLSGELSKFHEPGVQVKTQPTPLDEDFNEKVHIEEVVNAKFHGYKIVDRPSTPITTFKMKDVDRLKSLANLQKPKVNTGVQVSTAPTVKKPVMKRNLSITNTKIIQIDEEHDGLKNKKVNPTEVTHNMPAVAYNEFSFKYVEPKVKIDPQKNLQIQDMPSINIRSELKEQKVLQLDIIPENKNITDNTVTKANVVVIAIDHETENPTKQEPINIQPNFEQMHYSRPSYDKHQPIRKVSKMSTCDSSGSTVNVSSDTLQKMKTQKQINTVLRTSPKTSARIKIKKSIVGKKESEKRLHSNLDEWKRKLNSVYGQTSAGKIAKLTSKSNKKSPPKSSNLPSSSKTQSKSKLLNNTEYIPYSHLTLGGVRVSDIEKEISNIPYKSDIPLSPILDKILSSRENSFQNDSPRKARDSPKIFTTSDENLLQEVLDIEKTVSKTISKNLKKVNETTQKTQKIASESSEDKENNSYVDDFEDENSENTQYSDKKPKSSAASPEQKKSSDSSSGNKHESNINENDDSNSNIQNTTFTKALNLSFKNSVDVYEFVHSVDTQDTATQSNTIRKISLKETQTSPTNDKPNIQPIHNELWPMDPKGEVEKMFKLEKDFIKKMILDEYGDLLEINITKPSTSRDRQEIKEDKNVAAFQKNTQTSPAHVKSIMTSPTRTKTRTTSPLLSLTVDHHTSPMIVVTKEDEFKVEIDEGDAGISINLSSPRFSLRLPQTSREVLSNLEACSNYTAHKIEDDNKNLDNDKNKTDKVKSKTFGKNTVSSSSSVDGDKSSSEMSSLGEVKLKLRRRMKKSRIATVSESSSSSVVSKSSSDAQSGGILPLRSEGEVSVGQMKKPVKVSKSEGETSLGR